VTQQQELNLVVEGDVAVGPSSVPGLAFPTSLTKLVLSSPIQPELLGVVPPGLQGGLPGLKGGTCAWRC
jgi:hypothetical protein